MSPRVFATIDDRRTYGMWQRPRSEGMFGLSWEVTITGFVAVVVAMLTAVIVAFTAALAVAIVELIVLAPLAIRRDGRTGYERGVTTVQWFRTWMRREHIYRAGVFSRLGTAKLPGLHASSRLYESVDSSGWRFAMIHMPAPWHQYTVVLRCWPQGAQAVDQPIVDQWVACWGRFLATLGGAADVAAITAVIDSVPEYGGRLVAEVAELTRPDAPALASAMMRELAQTLPSDTVALSAWCSITFAATTPERRTSPPEQAVEIGRRLPGIVAALADAGVRARPMTAAEVVTTTRRAWDPASETDLDEVGSTTHGHGLTWDDAGPVSYDESTRQLHHDGVVSVSWEMAVAPEGSVDERVLQRLLAPNPQVPRKRVAVVYRPHSAGDAAEIVDDDYKNALVAARSARGVVSAAATLRVGATEQAREEQARGHGVTRFGILITITEPVGGDVPRIDAITRDLSAQARLKIRRCYRYQAAAFAAGLGIGVVLPGMATIPRTMAE